MNLLQKLMVNQARVRAQRSGSESEMESYRGLVNHLYRMGEITDQKREKLFP